MGAVASRQAAEAQTERERAAGSALAIKVATTATGACVHARHKQCVGGAGTAPGAAAKPAEPDDEYVAVDWLLRGVTDTRWREWVDAYSRQVEAGLEYPNDLQVASGGPSAAPPADTRGAIPTIRIAL